jgi:hypothetical protein
MNNPGLQDQAMAREPAIVNAYAIPKIDAEIRECRLLG